jgi:hypothetical protein
MAGLLDILKNVGYSIVKPLDKGARSQLESISMVSDLLQGKAPLRKNVGIEDFANSGVTGLLGGPARGIASTLDEEYQRTRTPQFLSPEDYDAYLNNESLESAKGGAYLASFGLGAAPAKGIGSIISQGVKAGAAAGFGATDSQKAEDLLSNAALGGAVGGVSAPLLSGAASLVSKFASKAPKTVKVPAQGSANITDDIISGLQSGVKAADSGETLIDDLVNAGKKIDLPDFTKPASRSQEIQAKGLLRDFLRFGKKSDVFKSPDAALPEVTKAIQAVEEASQITGKKLPFGNTTAKSNSLETAADFWVEKMDEASKNSGRKLDPEQIITELDDAINKVAPTQREKNYYVDLVTRVRNQLADNPAPSTASKLASKLRKELAGTKTATAADRKVVLDTLEGVLQKNVDELAPEISQISTMRLRPIRQIQDYIGEQVGNAPKFRQNLNGTIGDIVKTGQEAANALGLDDIADFDLSQAGTNVRANLTNVPDKLKQGVSGIQSEANQTAAAIPALLADLSGSNTPAVNGLPSTGNNEFTPLDLTPEELNRLGLNEDQTTELLLNMIDSKYDKGMIDIVAQLASQPEDDLTASERAVMQEAGIGLSQLDSIEQKLSSGTFGPLAGLFSAVNPGGKERITEDELNTAAQTIGRALEGGKLTDADIQRYKREILPGITDSPERAQEKINRLRQLLQQRRSGMTGTAGNDMTNLDLLEQLGG